MKRIFVLFLACSLLLTLGALGFMEPVPAQAAYVGTSTHKIISQKNYTIIDGMTETTLVFNDNAGKRIEGHMVSIAPGAAVTAKASYPGYYKSDSTEKSRASFADKPVWSKKTTTGQASDYTAATKQPVLFATNADNYYTETANNYIIGQPCGYLIMEGNQVQTTEMQKRPFFAVLKDGSFVIRDCWSDLSDVVEAVAGRKYLVKNGKNVVAQSASDALGLMPYNSIGLKADGTLVTFQVDGRRSDSIGITEMDMANYLVAQGVQTALILDGGGSATFATRRSGESKLTIRNQPSDGSERPIGSTLLFVPTDPSLFFDFSNQTADQTRYKSYVYEGNNYDKVDFWRATGSTNDTVAVNNTNGTLTLTKTASNTYNYFYTQTWSTSSSDRYKLRYRPEDAEYLQIRMTMSGFDPAVSGSGFQLFYYADGSSTQVTNAATHSFAAGTKFTGQSILLTLPIAQKFRDAEFIDSLKLNFSNISGAGKVVFDFIYIGPKNCLPEQDKLSFDFTNTPDEQMHYRSRTYGFNNYDRGYWAVNTARNTKPTFGSDTMSFQIAGTTDDYSATGIAPFVQTTDSGGQLANGALHYVPHSTDVVQVRFSMKNCAVKSGTSPAFRLYFGTDATGSMAGNVTQNIPTSYLTSGTYLTMTLPLKQVAAYSSASRITTVRMNFPNVRSADGKTGVITVDYLYIGPEATLPATQYTVTFKNADGSTLLTQTVLKGETAVYTGSTPTKAYDSTNHYTFKGWDKALTNITANTTVTAQYTATAHSYTYSKVDNTNHKASCSCGYSMTLSHGWDSGKITTAPTLTAAGVKTFTCTLCKTTKTETVAKLPKNLLFHFANASADQSRYNNYAYQFHNFDLASNSLWNPGSNASLSISNSTSAMVVTPKADVEVIVLALSKLLHYDPTYAEVYQIRLKAEGFSSPAENSPLITLDLYSGSTKIDVADASLTAVQLSSGNYFTVTVPLTEENRSTGIVDTLKVYCRMKGTSSAKLTLDYIYLGSKAELPTAQYTVTFKNADGTVLQTKTVHKGETAVYTGSTPTKAYDSTNHYTFKGWDKTLTNITANTTVTAQYTATAHSYSYSKVDNSNHKASCSCGYNKTVAHSWDSGKVTTEATCTATGIKTYTCTLCKGTKTETVGAKGHTKVTDKAVAPTCTAAGKTEGSHCSICGTVLVAQQTVPATGHSYNSGVITTQPTCTAAGVKTYTCTLCKGTKTETVGAKGHTKVTDKAVIPTCTTTGKTEGSHCSICGTILVAQQTVPATGHSYDSGTITKVPSLTAEGVKTFTCATCKTTKAEAVAKLQDTLFMDFTNNAEAKGRYNNYTYGFRNFDLSTQWRVAGSGTATADHSGGTMTFQSAVNGNYLVAHASESTSVEGSPLYFDPAKAEVVQLRLKLKNVGCVVGKTSLVTVDLFAGNTKFNLPDQGLYESQVLGEGYFLVTLQISQEFRTKGIVTNLHIYIGNVTVTADSKAVVDYIYVGPKAGLPTDAYTVTFKNADGTVLQTKTVHRGDTAIYTAATPTKAYDSNSHYSFKGWDKALTNITADTTFTAQFTSAAHSYTYSKVDDTTHSASCSCGYRKTESHCFTGGICGCGETEILPPQLNNSFKLYHSLNLASDISMNYLVPTTALEGYDMRTVYVECSYHAYTGNVRGEEIVLQLQPVLKEGYYYFTLEGLTAVHMSTELTAVLYGTKDEQLYYSPVDSYSIATYAYSQLNKTDIARELKVLCADLLRYGSAAQTYKGYRTDSLADSAMTAEHKSYLTNPDTVIFDNINKTSAEMADPRAPIAGKALLLDSKVTIKYIVDLSTYTGAPSDLSLVVSYTDLYGEKKSVVLTDIALYNRDLNYYSFEFDGLLAAELRQEVSATVYCGGTPMSATLHYSASTYGNNKTGALGHLCKCLMAYSDSARTYFTK